MAKINRGELMKTAWAIYRARDWRSMGAIRKPYNDTPGLWVEAKGHTFKAALRRAWSDAKMAAKAGSLAAGQEAMIGQASADLFMLKMKDRWDHRDFTRQSELNNEISRLGA